MILHETIYVASSNAGKLRDFAAAAAVFDVNIAVLPGVREIPAPAEDGETFEANARLKAGAYSRMKPGLLVLADDSGLEVDALNGAPGVRSARYADDAGFDVIDSEDADGRNNLYLLEQLHGHSRPWTARYRCVLALARDGVTLQRRRAELSKGRSSLSRMGQAALAMTRSSGYRGRGRRWERSIWRRSRS